MTRSMTMAYSIVSYVLFNLTFLYLAGFLLEIGVPKTINSGEAGPLAQAITINLGLIILFGATHSIMARDGFKRWWTKFIPEVAERSTYVLQSSLFLALAVWQWQPMPATIWQVEGVAAWAFYAAFGVGAFMLLWSTFLIDHFELFGLRQAWCCLRSVPTPAPKFRAPALYRLVRHPMQLGIIIMFLATPHMTAGHLLFASAMIAYILVGLYFEERSLTRIFGDAYRDYQARVPMLIPGLYLARARPQVVATLAN